MRPLKQPHNKWGRTNFSKLNAITHKPTTPTHNLSSDHLSNPKIPTHRRLWHQSKIGKTHKNTREGSLQTDQLHAICAPQTTPEYSAYPWWRRKRSSKRSAKHLRRKITINQKKRSLVLYSEIDTTFRDTVAHRTFPQRLLLGRRAKCSLGLTWNRSKRWPSFLTINVHLMYILCGTETMDDNARYWED